MTDVAIDRAGVKALRALDNVIDRYRFEVERALAIHELRAREGRTIGKKRAARLAAMTAQVEQLIHRLDAFLASHHDPAIVREAARLERSRART
jgi:hypothetical protein